MPNNLDLPGPIVNIPLAQNYGALDMKHNNRYNQDRLTP